MARSAGCGASPTRRRTRRSEVRTTGGARRQWSVVRIPCQRPGGRSLYCAESPVRRSIGSTVN